MSDKETLIPVSRIDRTLEQQQRDTVRDLERRRSRPSSRDIVPVTSNALIPRGTDDASFPHDWFNEIDRWVEQRHTRWNDELNRIWRNVFPLVPVDDTEFGPPSPFGAMRPFDHVPSIISGMRRQMDAMTRHMDQLMRQEDFGGPLFPFRDWNDGLFDFLQNAYEPDEHGNLKFKVRFNLQGYNPDDITVSSGRNRLVVRAKQSRRTSNSASSREYHRMIYLPDSVDDLNMTSRLTKDGILILEAPVKDADYSSITFDKGRQLAIKPPPESSSTPPTLSKHKRKEIRYLGKNGLTELNEGTDGRKIHVEVPMERGFTGDDMLVRIESNQLIVTGRKYVTEGRGSSESNFVKEFTRSYKLPGSVDTMSINTRVRGDTLLVEAPLLTYN